MLAGRRCHECRSRMDFEDYFYGNVWVRDDGRHIHAHHVDIELELELQLI